ncbi:hypothetical protein AGMMS49982_19660 [Bacteroidia bacterium]|nr:hypothetical protein AGMMS49982_19660 [Bacteroidia bacterium]
MAKTIFKIHSTVAIALFVCSTAVAQTWNIGSPNAADVTATLSGGTLTISGSGAMRDWTYDGSPWYSQRAGITTVVINDGVTTIGSFAFHDNSSLTSVTIPGSVTGIGQSAFAYCSGLTSVIIPGNVTSIAGSAFEGCSGLTSIIIPGSVTSIGEKSFEGCSKLTGIAVDAANAWYSSIDSVVYNKNQDSLLICPRGKQQDTFIIPNSVTCIGRYAFYYCSSLSSVAIPGSVTSIEQSAFQGCSGLTSVAIPGSVTSIGSSAFSACSYLTSVAIPGGVTSIESSAFSYCIGLASVIIPGSVTSIEYGAFQDCSSLVAITSLNSVPPNADDAFFGLNTSNCTLTVSICALPDYQKDTVWNKFGRIVADTSLPCSDPNAAIEEPEISLHEDAQYKY